MHKLEWIFIFIVVVILILLGIMLFPNNKQNSKRSDDTTTKETVVKGDFNFDLVRQVHENRNYLISPYSIEIALNMLRDGASGHTKEEIDKTVLKRVIHDVRDQRLQIANAAFIKDIYKDKVLKRFYDDLKNKYQAELLYDKFESPDVINNWVKEKTNGMIEKVIDSIDASFALGLANAVFLDAKWLSSFECDRTKEEAFVKDNNSVINVEMMHNTFKSSLIKYIDNDVVQGIVIPYKDTDGSDKKLEFVGLLPNNMKEFIDHLDSESVNTILKNSKSISNDEELHLSLPRFSYEYEIKDFIGVLKNLGINDVFNPNKSDLSRIMDITPNNLYVDTAVHKTKIELNEVGTKAAAVTFFGIRANGMLEKPRKEISITFNKPFVYLIRESTTGEIIFFGSVFEPNLWKGSTCSE